MKDIVFPELGISTAAFRIEVSETAQDYQVAFPAYGFQFGVHHEPTPEDALYDALVTHGISSRVARIEAEEYQQHRSGFTVTPVSEEAQA